jgi:hypothetical protein
MPTADGLLAIPGVLQDGGVALSGEAAERRDAAVMQALGAGLDALGVWLVVGDGHLHRLEGQAAILPAVTLLTFALCRGWVFA